MSTRLTIYADSVARLAADVRGLVLIEDLKTLAIELFALRASEADSVARLALAKLKR